MLPGKLYEVKLLNGDISSFANSFTYYDVWSSTTRGFLE
jgi:hypothetical protein